LRSVAEGLSAVDRVDAFEVIDAYVFGGLLDGPESLDVVSVAFVVDLPVEEVPWRARSAALEALASLMRLDKVPVERVWRPADWPVWNHVIVGAVRFWSRADGIDEDVMALLTHQRFGDLTGVGPPNRERYLEQLRVERNASRRHLHHVLDRYHDREWQRAHRSYTMYPEDHLWWAADAFVELDDAIRDELADRG
jgi:hypothetical protein